MARCACRGRAVMRATLAALFIAGTHADPGSVGCSQSLTSGSMMGASIQRSASTQVQLAKSGSPIACGSTLTAGDSGLELVKGTTGSRYIIEAVASAGTGSHGIISGSCSKQRLVDGISNNYTVPPSGTVTLRIAHASGYGTVTTSADCTYTVQAAQQAACEDCTAGKYRSSDDCTVCIACPGNSDSPARSTDRIACLCNAGYTDSNGETCTACEAAKYKDTAGAAACLGCPAHSSSPAGSDAITDCACVDGYSGENGGTCQSERSFSNASQTPYSCASDDDCNYPACGTASCGGFCGSTLARGCVSDCHLLCAEYLISLDIIVFSSPCSPWMSVTVKICMLVLSSLTPFLEPAQREEEEDTTGKACKWYGQPYCICPPFTGCDPSGPCGTRWRLCSEPQPCLPGKYSSNGIAVSMDSCQPCASPPGNYCPSGSTSLTGVACPVAYYCYGGDRDKQACPEGK